MPALLPQRRLLIHVLAPVLSQMITAPNQHVSSSFPSRELLPPAEGLIPVINSATLAMNRKRPNYCLSSCGVTVKSH